MCGTLRHKAYLSSKYKGRAKQAVFQPKYKMKVIGARKGRGSYKRNKRIEHDD